ncbi:MAG: F0F1 ATP synthase subunit delta [Verrucomicrobiales bacterium]|nr:F0F1 ATP synthase subunit delta [Verrucomicrobiales bacterium]
MKINKQARRDGKAILRRCLVNGRLDEARTREVVQQVVATKPRGYLRALTHFQRLVQLHLDSRRVRVENAVESSPQLMEGIRLALEKKYGPGLDITYWVNPALIGGLKIRVGSDVYDGSVHARLEELKSAF